MEITFIEFNPNSKIYWQQDAESFKCFCRLVYANSRFLQIDIFSQNPGVFAPSPAFRSPGVVGQGIPTIISAHPRKCICRKCNPVHLSGFFGQGAL